MLRAVGAGLRQLARQPVLQVGLQTAAASSGVRGFAALASTLPRVQAPGPASAAHAALVRAHLLRAHAVQLRSASTAESLQQAGQKLRSAIEAPAKAARAAGTALTKAPSAAYARLPPAARKWVDATQQPGSVQRVLSLQLDAFWQQHGRKVYAAGAALAAYVLWRSMYGVASLFVDLSNKMATGGFLALAVAIVLLGVQYLRHQVQVDPSAVYRLAMLRLNMHPGILEVMGAPLAGSDVRASVLTGGGLKFRGLRPRLRARRVQMMFPLRGSERRGLVSLEAKKRKGRYVFKLLAVDVPCVSGGQQRLFLEGGPAIYDRSAVLNELREPFLKALGMQDVWDKEDEADAADEAQHEQQEEWAATRQRALQAAAGTKAGAAQPAGAPAPSARLYLERASGAAQQAYASVRQAVEGLRQRLRQPGS